MHWFTIRDVDTSVYTSVTPSNMLHIKSVKNLLAAQYKQMRLAPISTLCIMLRLLITIPIPILILYQRNGCGLAPVFALCSVLKNLHTTEKLLATRRGVFYLSLEKICVFLAFLGVILLQHSRVRQEIRIIKFLCTARAVSRAGTAF